MKILLVSSYNYQVNHDGATRCMRLALQYPIMLRVGSSGFPRGPVRLRMESYYVIINLVVHVCQRCGRLKLPGHVSLLPELNFLDTLFLYKISDIAAEYGAPYLKKIVTYMPTIDKRITKLTLLWAIELSIPVVNINGTTCSTGHVLWIHAKSTYHRFRKHNDIESLES